MVAHTCNSSTWEAETRGSACFLLGPVKSGCMGAFVHLLIHSFLLGHRRVVQGAGGEEELLASPASFLSTLL